ncbi:MAG TPA: hypothetical protein P5055_00680 [Candidatus Paceibacterota bacterium]|nr:hypothetical protein [Candidatus Paceibacterota bacterium]
MKPNLILWILTAASMLTPLSNVEAAVAVYGQAASTGELVSIGLFSDISNTRLLSYGVRLGYDSSLVAVAKAEKNESQWFFSDGIKRYPYADPDASAPGEVLVIGGCLDGDNPLGGVAGDRVLLGRVVFKRLNATVPLFKLGIGHPTPFANFVNLEGKVLENIPGEVAFGPISADPEDLDLDGLKDAWEKRYFGRIDLAYYSDDPDRDNATNLEEQALGTDPTVSDATFRLTITKTAEGLLLEWPSVMNRIYTIEISTVLPLFTPLLKEISATPPTNHDLNAVLEYRDSMVVRVLSVEKP